MMLYLCQAMAQGHPCLDQVTRPLRTLRLQQQQRDPFSEAIKKTKIILGNMLCVYTTIGSLQNLWLGKYAGKKDHNE